MKRSRDSKMNWKQFKERIIMLMNSRMRSTQRISKLKDLLKPWVKVSRDTHNLKINKKNLLNTLTITFCLISCGRNYKPCKENKKKWEKRRYKLNKIYLLKRKKSLSITSVKSLSSSQKLKNTKSKSYRMKKREQLILLSTQRRC